jgi:HEAT repeat protein
MLLDRKPQVRLAAARALGIGRRDEAALLLRFKLLTGDGDGDVLAECIHSLTRIWPQKSVPYLAPYLDASDRVVRDNAAIALGGTRQREAFDLLKERWQFGGSGDAASRPALLLAIAMTRLPDAIELLLSIISSAKPDAAGDAIEAMGMYRHDEAVRTRLDAIITGRDAAELKTIFDQTFRPT